MRPTRDAVQVVSSRSPIWNELIRPARHDLYHSAEYHDFMQQYGYGEARLAFVGSRQRFFAWPFLLRNGISAGSAVLDASSVYGYTGPLAFGCEPGDPFLAEAIGAVAERWSADGIVSVFSRFHPLLENFRWVEGLPGRPAADIRLTLQGYTVSLDLTRTDSEAWSDYRLTHRRNIARARRFGLVAAVDDDFDYLTEFVRLYHDTMRRNHADQEYFYPASYFDDLRKILRPAISLHVVRLGSDIAAAALVSEHQGIVQYLFGGAEDRFCGLSPMKVLVDAIRKWARDRGNRVLHLGGGVGGHEDSLFYFKAGFSHRRHPFHTASCILDAERYRSLTEQHRRTALELGKTVNPNFFPAYRAPSTEPKEERALAGQTTLV